MTTNNSEMQGDDKIYSAVASTKQTAEWGMGRLNSDVFMGDDLILGLRLKNSGKRFYVGWIKIGRKARERSFIVKQDVLFVAG